MKRFEFIEVAKYLALSFSDDVAEFSYYERASKVRAAVVVAFADVREVVRSVACDIKGHDWEDAGFANPERGCIDMVCTRCGKAAGRRWLY